MEITGIKDQICDVCHKMWQLGWVAANDGNVSVRLDDGTYLATPTGMSKSFITSDKLLRIDAAGCAPQHGHVQHDRGCRSHRCGSADTIWYTEHDRGSRCH